MASGFNTGFKSQREFGWLLAIWLFLSGSACGLFLLTKLFALPQFYSLLAFATILVGGCVLLFEQGSPARAWRAISRPGSSWLSRGVLFVTLFILASFLSLAPTFFALPWDGAIPGWIAALCALMIVLYPGFFLAKNRSIPFWNSAWLPATFVAYAALSACAMVLVGAAFLPKLPGLGLFRILAASLIAVNAVMVGGYLLSMQRAGGAAQEAVRLLNSPPLSGIFRLGVVLVGLILPLALLLLLESAAALAGAGLCLLAGSFLFRYCVLTAGVYVQPGLVQAGVDFSRLNRSDSNLQREYANMAQATTATTGGGRK